MNFEFLLFIIFSTIVYYVFPDRARKYALLLLSCAYYLLFGLKGILLVVVISVCTYIFADILEKNKKRYLYGGYVLLIITILLVGRSVGFLQGMLPIGNAFMALRCVGYVTDVYWDKYKADKNVCNVALFVMFFPVAQMGPITRYDAMSGEFNKKHILAFDNIADGLFRIMVGTFKKLVIADRIALYTEAVIANDSNGVIVFAMLMIYSVQLYCDFAGGIDIAIGISRLFGITVGENFKLPYLAENLAQFWHRWHISMGDWFKDYVFYPVSTNKKLKNIFKRRGASTRNATMMAVITGLVITWFLTGVWHGNEGRFVVWGLLNGIIIIAIRVLGLDKKKSDGGIKRCLSIVGTFALVSLLRVFDCYGNVGLCFEKLGKIFTGGIKGFDVFLLYGTGEIVLILVFVPFVFLCGALQGKKGENATIIRFASAFVIALLVLVFGMYGIGYESREFIYGAY